MYNRTGVSNNGRARDRGPQKGSMCLHHLFFQKVSAEDLACFLSAFGLFLFTWYFSIISLFCKRFSNLWADSLTLYQGILPLIRAGSRAGLGEPLPPLSPQPHCALQPSWSPCTLLSTRWPAPCFLFLQLLHTQTMAGTFTAIYPGAASFST